METVRTVEGAMAANPAAPSEELAPRALPRSTGSTLAGLRDFLAPIAEVVIIMSGVALLSMLVFGLFLIVLAGKDPLAVYADMWTGSFGTRFSQSASLAKAAPLMLTALCTALPARLGMVVIGNEGALLLGGLGGVIVAQIFGADVPMVTIPAMLLFGGIVGGLWIALAGSLRQFRGVNETISSLLLYYIALSLFNFTVEDLIRDPTSLNKPSTVHIGEANMIGLIPGLPEWFPEVHWGLFLGLAACIAMYVLMDHSTFGFATRIVGGNLKAARLQGLPISLIVLTTCLLGGAAAGIAGVVEMAVAEGKANASLAAGLGFSGILVAFVARQNPLAIIPVALLFGGITASGGLIQRRHDLPDATVDVFTGILFILVLASETFVGRIKWLQPREGDR
jgi:general nucleoside transport system permease protein